MKFLDKGIKWIMLISGVLTCTMIYAAISPRAALNSTFGESLEGPLAEIVVRNWGALIFLVGAMLIYGAFKAGVRPLVLTIAALSKVVFIALLVSLGQIYLSKAATPVIIDSIMVIVFSIYLLTNRDASQQIA